MSERGSFVTQYLYCDACYAAAMSVLDEKSKYLCVLTADPRASFTDTSTSAVNIPIPIIAGKVGGNFSGEDLFIFEFDLVDKLEAVICCPMRIAVLSDNGEDKIFHLKPKDKKGN